MRPDRRMAFRIVELPEVLPISQRTANRLVYERAAFGPVDELPRLDNGTVLIPRAAIEAWLARNQNSPADDDPGEAERPT